jgi:hypothetical protein
VRAGQERFAVRTFPDFEFGGSEVGGQDAAEAVAPGRPPDMNLARV